VHCVRRHHLRARTSSTSNEKRGLGWEQAVVRARDFKEPGERWEMDQEGLDKFAGAPWEPHPGANGEYELSEAQGQLATGAR
jgi:hypothetical protein